MGYDTSLKFDVPAALRPDLVLRDLRTIFSGDSVPTCYYKRLE